MQRISERLKKSAPDSEDARTGEEPAENGETI